jgi:hypothetical protein
MKYRGVKIQQVKWFDSIDIGKREDSPVKAVWKTSYAPLGVNYPMTLEECRKSIDDLIRLTMSCCDIGEHAAVGLLNEA